MTSPGEIALRLQDQGWRGVLPLLPHDATPHVRLAPDKVAEVERGRGKAPGTLAPRAGWSLISDWRGDPDDTGTIEGWAQGAGGKGGVRGRPAAPGGVVIDADVL